LFFFCDGDSCEPFWYDDVSHLHMDILYVSRIPSLPQRIGFDPLYRQHFCAQLVVIGQSDTNPSYHFWRNL